MQNINVTFGVLFDCSTYADCGNKNVCYVMFYVMSMFCNEAIRCQISKSIKVIPCNFVLALCFRDVNVHLFCLQNVGQGHEV